jgi:hypothetical protein
MAGSLLLMQLRWCARRAMTETLILNRAEIEALMSPAEALGPMRDAFRLHSTGRTVPTLRVPSPLPPPAPANASSMILVPGIVPGIPAYTVKVHAKYPGSNPAIQGIIILSSLETGATLAILESGFLTALRTGLAGAIGADLLARRDARTLAIVGPAYRACCNSECFCSFARSLGCAFTTSYRSGRRRLQTDTAIVRVSRSSLSTVWMARSTEPTSSGYGNLGHCTFSAHRHGRFRNAHNDLGSRPTRQSGSERRSARAFVLCLR